MSAISSLTENWNGHSFQEVETHVKGNYPSKVKEITYSALKTLRDNSQLVPGQWYRITDYVTTTSKSNTRVVSNLSFNPIVFANSVKTIDEKHVHAVRSDGSFLNWELHYCLDNNIARFNWVDSTNGKGVVYYMKDEYNNECPYDFKNIQFKRYKLAVTGTSTSNSSVNGTWGLKDSYCFPTGVTINSNFRKKEKIEKDSDYIWCYTFQYIHYNSNAEGTMAAQILAKSTFYGNVIKPCFSSVTDSSNMNFGEGCVQSLNDIVLIGNDTPCYNNYFDNNCTNITLLNNCRFNKFEKCCNNIFIGSGCELLSFKMYCEDIYIGSNCLNLNFGVYCNTCIIGDDCHDLIISDESEIIVGCGSENIFLDICCTVKLWDFAKNIYCGQNSSLTCKKSYCESIKLEFTNEVNLTTSGTTSISNPIGYFICTPYTNPSVDRTPGDMVTWRYEEASGDIIIKN